MNLQVFLMALMIVSIMTTLFTEAIKTLFDDFGWTYYANTLAGIVSVVISAAVGSAYFILTETAFNMKMAVILIALVLLSWLCAMVGYDKVRQAIDQITGVKK